MRFIHERNFHPGGIKTVIPPFIGVFRHPDLPGKIISGRILDGPGNPCGNAISARAVRTDHVHLHLLPVGQRIRRQRNFPHAALIPLQRVALPVPAVKIPNQGHPAGGGSPFPVCPRPRLRVSVETVIAVSARVFLQRAGALIDPLHFQVKQTLAVAYLAGIRLEPSVRHHQAGYRGSSHYLMIPLLNQQGQGRKKGFSLRGKKRVRPFNRAREGAPYHACTSS